MNLSATTRSISIGAAIYAIAGGAVSLAGWLFTVPGMLDWAGTGIKIAPNTATCLIGVGLGLLAHIIWPTRKFPACLFGVAIAAMAAATLFEHISGSDLGIDTYFFADAFSASGGETPGRMGVPASASLLMLGTALALLPLNKRARFCASVLGVVVLGIASLSLVGYLFGASELYSIARITGIAIQTATMIAALGIGVAFAVPEQGIIGTLFREDTGGLVFRKLIVPAILASLIIGWLRISGQQAGLFDTAFGTAARTIAEIILLLLLLWRTTIHISHAEAETRLLARLPRENPNPVIRLSSAGDVLYTNDASVNTLIDWSAGDGDVVAKTLRSLSRQALRQNEKITAEIELGGRFYSCLLAPITDSGYVNVYATDISDRKRSEGQLSRRVQELGALYRFTDRLNHSVRSSEIYAAALDAIMEALQCDRGAILLFDENDVMSFVAWRGLSDRYRTAVNGHSPWTIGEENATPFGVTDIEKSDQPDDLKSVIKDEGITALAFIPLISNGRLIGKFMVYYDQAHEFTEGETELALTIAHQIAFGVERRRIEERRRQTEAALRENDTRLRLATRTGKIGVWDWDIQSNRVSWTESLYVMHGIDESGFDGTVEGFSELIHADDRPLVADAIKAAVSGDKPFEVEFRSIRPDGQLVWLYTNATVLRDADGPLRMIGATIDITERKLAELEKGKLASIVESSTDAIISKDLNSTITSWNRAAEELFGYSAAEAVGRPITMLIPKDRLAEEAIILERICKGLNIQHYETVRQRKDGSRVDLSLSISPIIDAKGTVIGASKIARDVTQRKAAELAMKQSETMRTIVNAQEGERHRIARDLHDHLGQQLTALRLKLESIKVKSNGNEDLIREIDETRAQAERIDLDINFLSWELRPTELDNLGLTDALGSFVREWSVSHAIAAEFHATGTKKGRFDPEIETNLYRIVQEGLNNILKHANAKKVSVLLESRDDNAVLIIEDDGIGFDPELKGRPLTNGKPKSKSKGLGLVGMRERAALLGGSLEIESHPGGGTSLFARVPLRQLGTNGSQAIEGESDTV